MDVKIAFLNGDLTEEVYMKPHPGYSCSPSQVCKFRRALYGLKQVPHASFTKFSSTIRKFSFNSSASDRSLFIRKTHRGITFLVLYVDDIVITRNDVVGISGLRQSLNNHFETKDLGHLNYFLGLEILSNSAGYYLF